MVYDKQKLKLGTRVKCDRSCHPHDSVEYAFRPHLDLRISVPCAADSYRIVNYQWIVCAVLKVHEIRVRSFQRCDIEKHHSREGTVHEAFYAVSRSAGALTATNTDVTHQDIPQR